MLNALNSPRHAISPPHSNSPGQIHDFRARALLSPRLQGLAHAPPQPRRQRSDERHVHGHGGAGQTGPVLEVDAQRRRAGAPRSADPQLRQDDAGRRGVRRGRVRALEAPPHGLEDGLVDLHEPAVAGQE